MSDKEVTKILVDIATINKYMSNEENLKSMNNDTLSYTGLKLAAMKASLLDVKVDAHRDMLKKEVLREKAKAEAYYKYKKEHGSTAAGDMKYMDEDFIKAQEAYNESKVQFERLKTLLTDTHDTLDMIKSRVIDQQGQRKDERLK